jgi:hypothetical protein
VRTTLYCICPIKKTTRTKTRDDGTTYEVNDLWLMAPIKIVGDEDRARAEVIARGGPNVFSYTCLEVRIEIG